MRSVIADRVPGTVAESPTPGTGKDQLVRKSWVAALGDEPATIPEARDDDEWRKQFTTTFLSSPSAILISNVNRKLDSGHYARALTQPRWDDRLLGGNKEVSVPIRAVIAVTANNPMLSPELARRHIRIRLDAGIEQPWLRSGFRHDLEKWTAEHRAELAWAYLTLVRHWFAQGQPKGTQKLGNYERWSEVIGGILGAADIPGFLGNLDAFYEAVDSESDGWRAFTELWWTVFQDRPVRANELFSLLQDAEGIEADTSRALGRQLSKHRDMTFGKLRIKAGTLQHGNARWRLERAFPESDTERKQREKTYKEWEENRPKLAQPNA